MTYNADDGRVELSIAKTADLCSFSDDEIVVREIKLSSYVGDIHYFSLPVIVEMKKKKEDKIRVRYFQEMPVEIKA